MSVQANRIKIVIAFCIMVTFVGCATQNAGNTQATAPITPVQVSSVERCDMLAAHPNDPDKPAKVKGAYSD